MTDQQVLIATLVVYLAACLALGVVAWRRTQSLADYILGGRALGSWVTAFSAQASDMSGWLLLGLPGLAYTAGLDAAWLAAGLIIGTWANWRYVAAPLRLATEACDDSLTLPDYFERRFTDRSRILRLTTAGFILLFFTFYASSGFVAAARLFESMFGMSYPAALFWGSIVMLGYTFLGGFLAISWSDVIQGTLMFFALILVAAIGVVLAGGAADLANALERQDPLLLDPFIGSGSTSLGAIGVISLLAWGLGYPGQPHILARFMAIRSVDRLPVARRVAMVWVISVLAAALLVGLAGRAILDPPLTGANSEKVFIVLASTQLLPVLAGLCLAGILAAVMSTASAQLLVAASAFAQDFYRGLLRPQAQQGDLLWIGRIAVLVVAAAAYLIALDPNNRVLDLVGWAWAGFGATFGPAIILSLYWPRATRSGITSGMLVGGVTVILWPYGSGGLFSLYELVPGFLLSFATIMLVSAFSPSADRSAT